jgi:quinol monooxygenase YgiN
MKLFILAANATAGIAAMALNLPRPRGDFPKIFYVAIRFHPPDRPWCVRNRRRYVMSGESAILINLLKVKPGKQDALIALLKQNIDTVIRTLHGWRATRLIAAKDGAGVVIYSEWENPAAIEAMRNDPRMKAYFPKIAELASLDSIVGSAVLSETR